MLKHGITVKDIITNFSGVVTGTCQYITGCDQALVTPAMKTDGSLPEPRWIDEQRLEVDPSQGEITLDNGQTPGADIPAPIR